MTSTPQHENWIAKILRRAASSALASAVVLAPTIIATPSAQAQTYTVLHTFKGGADGARPLAGLVGDAGGNLYGTTGNGGDANVGTVFQVTTTGKERVLHMFTMSPDGEVPYAPLILDPAGNLYGTAPNGGGGFNLGMVFKLDTARNETVLYSFRGPDGAVPDTPLIQDAAGNLYGTTSWGGAFSRGAVFKLDTAGNETVLHSFTGQEDGGYPSSGLVRDAVGNFYGTATGGGDLICNPPDGCGAVFKVSRTSFDVLYEFTGGSDGIGPKGLVRDATGNFYGVTVVGGNFQGICAAYGCGTVFKVDATGKETVLYRFTGGADGGYPRAVLVRDPAGNLYGTTERGGDLACYVGSGCGTVFKLDTTGTETILHAFTGGADGLFPESSLVRDSTGNLYGTTSLGGDLRCYSPNGCGIVFKITP